VFLELLAVHLGVHQHARQVVGGVLAALGDQPRTTLEDLGNVFLQGAVDAAGVHVRVGSAERRVHQARPDRVVLLGDAHEAADHARDHRLGDVGDQVAAVAGGRAFQTIEHLDHDRADRILVRGDPTRREARLEQRLEAIVLGRVHADEHRAHELDREHAGRRDPLF
jgi:hypothetical protein